MGPLTQRPLPARSTQEEEEGSESASSSSSISAFAPPRTTLPPCPTTKQNISNLSRALNRVLDATLRGLAAGLGVRGGLHLVSLLLAVATRKDRGAGRLGRARLLAILWESLRFGSFLGSFAGVAVSVDEAISAVFGREPSASWRALAAGFLAGPTLLLAGPNPHPSIASYLLVRAIALLFRVGNKRDSPAWVRKLLFPTRLPHAEVSVFCAAVAQILFSFFAMPDTLPSSYVRFLGRAASKPSYVWEAVRELISRNAQLRAAHLQQRRTQLIRTSRRRSTTSVSPGWPWRYLWGSRVSRCDPRPLPWLWRGPLISLEGTPYHNRAVSCPCEFTTVLAPRDVATSTSTSASTIYSSAPHLCTAHALGQLPRIFWTALPIYLPVYLVPAVLLHRRKLLHPTEGPILFGKLALGVARSSAFLGSLFTLLWQGACLGWRVAGVRGEVLAVSAAGAGLALLVEKPSRRPELAMYAMARAMESFALVLDKTKVLPRWVLRRRPDVLIFAVASALILHCYSGCHGAHRDVFREKYLGLLDSMLGNEGVDAGTIRHVPSVQQIASVAVRRIASVPSEISKMRGIEDGRTHAASARERDQTVYRR
jgi:hypothetical protein